MATEIHHSLTPEQRTLLPEDLGLVEERLQTVAVLMHARRSWFPSQGNVGVASGLATPSGEWLCAEWGIVNTGGAGPTVASLRELMEAQQAIPIKP